MLKRLFPIFVLGLLFSGCSRDVGTVYIVNNGAETTLFKINDKDMADKVKLQPGQFDASGMMLKMDETLKVYEGGKVAKEYTPADLGLVEGKVQSSYIVEPPGPFVLADYTDFYGAEGEPVKSDARITFIHDFRDEGIYTSDEEAVVSGPDMDALKGFGVRKGETKKVFRIIRIPADLKDEQMNEYLDAEFMDKISKAQGRR